MAEKICTSPGAVPRCGQHRVHPVLLAKRTRRPDELDRQSVSGGQAFRVGRTASRSGSAKRG